jgi:hypothetical protein
MINNFIKKIDNSIFLFFLFSSLFITIRLVLIGSRQSISIGESIFSILPEIIVFFILIIFIFPFIKNQSQLRFNYLDWIVFTYIFTNVAIGIIVAQNLKLSIYAVRMTYLPMCFYFIASNYSWDLDRLKSLTDKIFNWFFIVGLIGLVLYFGFHDFMIDMLKLSSLSVKEYFKVRMTSIFWSPVIFGTFMTACSIYFFYQSIQKSSFKNYLYQIILAFCVYFSISRGAIIILVIGIILITILSKKLKPFLFFIFIFLIAFFVVSIYISTPSEFIIWIQQSTSETISLKVGVSRVDLWIQTISDIQQYPFGRGLGKAGHVAARFFDNSATDASITSTDGWFLKLANETGVWGLFSYFFFTIFIFYNSIKYIRYYGVDFFTFLFVFFIVFNIQNLVSNVLDFYLFSYLFWFFIGMMVFHFKLHSSTVLIRNE